ncbi:PepSY domain-containing protein [Mycobacterium sp. KBS0706]|nr:PepSY domain-containing protein [Mycobacterium sp. KBS0706]
MLRTALLAALLAVGVGGSMAAAQTTAPSTTTPSNDPAATADTKQGVVLTSPAELQKGANSFTEAQATSRLEDHGFTGVTGLTKDDAGIWWATASKGGKSVKVGLDYQGNVATQ